ncbi:MAG: S26 family signal peptidase, partial [Paraprevotella sp.]|nr:S26 family signal peptidase [Paraprevotella sp.]
VELVGESLPATLVEDLGISQDDLRDYYQSGILPLTQAAKQTLEKRKEVVANISIIHNSETGALYPQNAYTGWTCDNYGPIWIPKKGETLKLTLENLPIYERPIRAYEGNDLQVTPEGKILINGQETNEYTFQMDYYWMQGDNRHNSADSRYWGFVPEDHVVGKPVLVWFSTDKDHPLLSIRHIRWNRLFRWVENMK